MSNNLRALCDNAKFLIVEDFENFRTSLRLMLSSFGANSIDTASNAEHALSLCKYQSYDVILCDFNLGDGKNGQQLLEELRLRKRLKRTHLFAMISADTSKDAVLGTKEFQPDAYVAKPITRNTLEQRLSQLLNQQSQLRPINREIDLENYAKAISLCKQEIDQKSRFRSWSLQTMAELYLKMGDTSSAQKIYTEVLSARNIDWAKLGLGKVYFSTSQFKAAKSMYSDIIEKSPYMIEAYDGASDSCLKLGQPDQAQEVLEEAVALCPRTVTRQFKLANICVENNDLHRGAEAFRRAINLAENTVHEQPDLYLDFGRCLCDLASKNKSTEGKSFANEASQHLEKLIEKFHGEDDACQRASLIKAQVFSGQGDQINAKALIEEVRHNIDPNSISVELGLELGRALYANGDTAEAEKALIKLSKRFENDPDSLSKIESLLDEPEPLETRVKAKDLNHSGIQLFEQGDFEQAIELFDQALKLTPKHAALNLNLAQVALRAYRELNQDRFLAIAKECAERIQHIPEQHKQYRRLQHIRATLDKTDQG